MSFLITTVVLWGTARGLSSLLIRCTRGGMVASPDSFVAMTLAALYDLHMALEPVFDRTGACCGWIDQDELLGLGGEVIGWTQNGLVYSSQGNQVGWVERGHLWDNRGRAVVWTTDASGGPRKPDPERPTEQPSVRIDSGRRPFGGQHGNPTFGTAWADTSWTDFLEK